MQFKNFFFSAAALLAVANAQNATNGTSATHTKNAAGGQLRVDNMGAAGAAVAAALAFLV